MLQRLNQVLSNRIGKQKSIHYAWIHAKGLLKMTLVCLPNNVKIWKVHKEVLKFQELFVVWAQLFWYQKILSTSIVLWFRNFASNKSVQKGSESCNMMQAVLLEPSFPIVEKHMCSKLKNILYGIWVLERKISRCMVLYCFIHI